MKGILVLLAACAALLSAGGPSSAPAATAQAETCPLPNQRPLWLDFGTPDVEAVLARPGVVMSASSGDFPARVRSKGARTVYWDMHLRRRIGTPTAPFTAEQVVERANSLYEFAVRQMACRDPIIALNELHGAHLETPWSPSVTQYRANILSFVKVLAERGAKPHLLIANDAYTASEEAAEWWRAVAAHAVLVDEVYFSYPPLHKLGPVLANRRVRVSMRRAIARLTDVGIRPARLGVILGFHPVGAGGLPQLDAFELVKWQALAAQQVASELSLGFVWSWGWGTYTAGIDRSAKPKAACVYLWTRNPRLCNGPRAAGEGFETSRADGQLSSIPGGQACVVGERTIGAAQLGALARLTGDREIAGSLLLARLAESGYERVRPSAVRAAERAVIRVRFGGSASAYRAALARANASVGIARAALADDLRRAQREARLRGRRPSAREVQTFYFSYPDLAVREVRANPAPEWLGRRKAGFALHSVAPERVFTLPAGRKLTVFGPDRDYRVTAVGETRALGSVPFAQVRPAISGALGAYARRAEFERWTVSRQQVAQNRAICRRDEVPEPGTMRVSAFLPFLSLVG